LILETYEAWLTPDSFPGAVPKYASTERRGYQPKIKKWVENPVEEFLVDSFSLRVSNADY
jgi:hypothetical protein